MEKKEYIAPQLTVVEFRMEQGYASSLLRLTLEQNAFFNDQGQEKWDETSGSLFDTW